MARPHPAYPTESEPTHPSRSGGRPSRRIRSRTHARHRGSVSWTTPRRPHRRRARRRTARHTVAAVDAVCRLRARAPMSASPTRHVHRPRLLRCCRAHEMMIRPPMPTLSPPRCRARSAPAGPPSPPSQMPSQRRWVRAAVGRRSLGWRCYCWAAASWCMRAHRRCKAGGGGGGAGGTSAAQPRSQAQPYEHSRAQPTCR